MDKFNKDRRVVIKGVAAAGISVLAVDKAIALTSLVANKSTGPANLADREPLHVKNDMALNQLNMFDEIMFAQTAWSNQLLKTGTLSL